MDQLRPWIAREVQAAVPGGGNGNGNGAAGSGRTRLVVDVAEALLKNNDVETQEGYCTVKEQVCARVDGHFLAFDTCGLSLFFHVFFPSNSFFMYCLL